MDDNQAFWLSLTIGIICIFVTVITAIKEHHQTTRSFIEHGYIQIQDIGNPSKHWIKS